MNKIKVLLPALLWLLLALPGQTAAQQDDELQVYDVRLSNYGGNNFVVTWRTNQPTNDNELLLGLEPGALTQVRRDTLQPPSQIHFVQVTQLAIDSTYYYKVRSDEAEGAGSILGYDSVLTRLPPFPSLGGNLQGTVVDAKTREPLRNVIVRSFYRWTRVLETGTLIDSTMLYAVLTNADGKFVMNMGNYRRFDGSNAPYFAGQTMLFLEILSQDQGEVRDSVLLTFQANDVNEFQVLGPYEVADQRNQARNGYIRATGPVLNNGRSASVVTVTVLDADNVPIPNVEIELRATPDRGISYFQPQTPTDRNGQVWGLVYSNVAEIKTISAINVTSPDTLDHVALDSLASAEFIPELNADIARDTVAPFFYFTTEYPNTQDVNGPYQINAKVVDNFWFSTDLLYSTQAGSYEDTVRMVNVPNTNDEYTAGIPGQPFNTAVGYIIVATDTAGHVASRPDSVHSSQFVAPYTFDVLSDINIVPELGITLTTDALTTTNTILPVKIESWIHSNVKINSVVVKYRNISNSDTFFDLKMQNYGAHYWTEIPPRSAGSRIEYFVQVTDSLGNVERDRRRAPYLNASFSYDVVSPGSLGEVTFVDTTDQLGSLAALPSRASVVADFNEDGYLDVVVANYGEINNAYIYNKVIGFADQTASVLGVQSRDNTTHVAVADVNADDYLDLIFATDNGQNRLYINNTRGRFEDMTFEFADSDGNTFMPEDDWGTSCIVTADFDGDGDMDLYVANSRQGGEQNRLLFNDGRGVFTDVSATRLSNEPALQSIWAIVGDVNNDNRPDVVVINRASEHYYMRNEGNGILRYHALSSGTSANARGGDLADVDSDGDLDLVVAQSDFTMNELYLNSGFGEFTRDNTGRLPAESDETYGVRFFDANADGFLDLYYLNFGQANRLLVNDQLGNFEDAYVGLMPTWSSNSRHASVADFNNDNRVDLYIAEEQRKNTMLFSRSFDPNGADLPSGFDLQAPGDGDTVNTTTVSFVWNASTSQDSTDTLVYDFLLSLDDQFSMSSLVASQDNLTDTTLTVSPINDNTRYFWKVFVRGKSGYPVSSNQTHDFMLLTTHQGSGPEFFVLINRNPVFAGHVTAYIISSEQLLTNPTVAFNNQQVAAIQVGTNNIYRAHYTTRSSFLLTISGRNLAGALGEYSKTYSSSLASTRLAVRALTPDRSAWLELPASAADDGVRLLASTNQPVGDDRLKEAVSELAGSLGGDLRSMVEVLSYTFTLLEGAIGTGARVVIDGKGVEDPGRMAVCRLEERGWQPLPTIYDPATGTFSAAVDRDGTYALLAFGPGSSRLPRASSFSLAQNSPNPFNPSTFISFTVPGDEPVEGFSLKVYNLRGQVVSTLVSGTVQPGSHSVQWSGKTDGGRDVPSGVYFYRMSAPGAVIMRKMVLLR